MAERTTDLRTASHRRLVVRTLVSALRNVFDDSYDRDRQLIDLKVTNAFPLVQQDYPCITVEYQPGPNRNAGVGHEEWFQDDQGVLRRWNHRFIQGTVSFHCFALSPLDRDLLADALEEVITFGRLDSALVPFFNTIYGDPADPVRLIFSQIMFNSDEIENSPNAESLAPWNPEDQLVYDTSLSCDIRVGLYNVQPSETWQIVTRARADAYPQFEETETLKLPFADPSTPWTNPFVWEDDDTVTGVAVISGEEEGP